MSMVIRYVSLSAAIRRAYAKFKAKMVAKCREAIEDINDELVFIEECRSEAMQKLHKDNEQAMLDIEAEYKAEVEAAAKRMQERRNAQHTKFQDERRDIALKAKGKVSELVKNRVLLQLELDNLTK